MKENKPILFINSASTNNFYQKNQFVYDSRRKNNNIKQSKPIIEENVNVNNNEDNNYQTEQSDNLNEMTEMIETTVAEENEVIENEKPVIEPIKEEVVEIEKPFANKIRLLTKRALLNRFVLVAIVFNEDEIEGLFKNSDQKKIILETNGEDREILIDDIVDIRIIRV